MEKVAGYLEKKVWAFLEHVQVYFEEMRNAISGTILF